jgi:hypothetical protein
MKNPARNSYILPLVLFLIEFYQLYQYESIDATPVNRIILFALIAVITLVTWSTSAIVEAILSRKGKE